METVNCLDHGFVRLVDSMGSDLSVVRAARVSHDAAWRAGENEQSDKRLIGYLWRNHHTSPFEAVQFTFEVKAPIFIFRQWHRHRTWSYNELSARYRELPEEIYIPRREDIGIQSAGNKQARNIDPIDPATLDIREEELKDYLYSCEGQFKLYRRLLGSGWPRELARMVLPLSTYSHMFASVNLGNLFKFIALRDHSHAQHEIQVYARALLVLAKTVAPVCCQAFEESRNA